MSKTWDVWGLLSVGGDWAWCEAATDARGELAFMIHLSIPISTLSWRNCCLFGQWGTRSLCSGLLVKSCTVNLSYGLSLQTANKTGNTSHLSSPSFQLLVLFSVHLPPLPRRLESRAVENNSTTRRWTILRCRPAHEEGPPGRPPGPTSQRVRWANGRSAVGRPPGPAMPMILVGAIARVPSGRHSRNPVGSDENDQAYDGRTKEEKQAAELAVLKPTVSFAIWCPSQPRRRRRPKGGTRTL